MTTTNSWPGKSGVPLNPEKDGWHWLARKNQEFPEVWEWNAGPLGAVAEYGDQSIGAWLESEGDGQPEGMAKWYRYLGPCLRPDEETALQARVAELEDFCEDYLVRFELFHVTNTKEAPEDATGFLAEKARAILGAALEGKKE